MPRLPPNQGKSKPIAAVAKQGGAGAAAMGPPLKAPYCSRDTDKEKPEPLKLDVQRENNNSPSSSADNLDAKCPSPSLASSSSTQPYRSQNSRTSKAERVLGLTPQDLENEAKLRRRNCQTPSISIDSPQASAKQRHTSSEAHSLDAHPRSSSQKSSSSSSKGGGVGVLRLPERRGAVAQVASISDLKRIAHGGAEGSEVESDVDQSSSVGDEGSTRSSPYPTKKEPSRGRDRFKKILRPLTRSRSAGAGDSVPAYALFLRQTPHHEHQHQHPSSSAVNRSTDDVMRNSTDCTEESDDETIDGNNRSKAKKTRKTKKDRFAFFRRSAEGHSSNALLPSSETLQAWTKSFEKLLADNYGLNLFREFLRREFSNENIEFWIECEKYRHLSSEKHRVVEAKRIFQEFVAVQSPSEINVDSKTREATESNLCRADTKVFEAAQKRIEALMEKDSYPRFIQSELFQRILTQRQTADNSSIKVT